MLFAPSFMGYNAKQLPGALFWPGMVIIRTS